MALNIEAESLLSTWTLAANFTTGMPSSIYLRKNIFCSHRAELVDPSLRTETNFAVFTAEARDFLSTWAIAFVNSFADSEFL